MKKLVVLTLLLAAAQFGYSQGTVNFFTAQSAGSKITENSASVSSTANPNARAALYGGPAGSLEAQLVLITPIAPFQSGTLAGYISDGSRTVPGVPQGGTAVLQIRAWDGPAVYSSYENAVLSGLTSAYIGKSKLYTVSGLGGPGDPANGVPPATAPNIPGQVGFAIVPVPEPGTIALGFLGLGAMFMLRRKK